MTVIRVPAVLLARVLVSAVRDLASAIGAILYGLGRVALRLLWVATVVLIAWALFMRATVHVLMPPAVWLGLTGAWLTATALWLLGGLLQHAARPRPDRAHIHGRPGAPPVSAQRIQEWERAWRRALRYQQTTSRRADHGGRSASDHHDRAEPGSAPAPSPYEILGVDPGVTQEQLRAAYRELAMRVHPDHNPGFVADAAERFAAIHSAYELLSEPSRRAAYDQRSRRP